MRRPEPFPALSPAPRPRLSSSKKEGVDAGRWRHNGRVLAPVQRGCRCARRYHHRCGEMAERGTMVAGGGAAKVDRQLAETIVANAPLAVKATKEAAVRGRQGTNSLRCGRAPTGRTPGQFVHGAVARSVCAAEVERWPTAMHSSMAVSQSFWLSACRVISLAISAAPLLPFGSSVPSMTLLCRSFLTSPIHGSGPRPEQSHQILTAERLPIPGTLLCPLQS